MGFLDNSGLAYLWGKITTALSGKLDTTGNAYRTASIPFAQVDSTSTSTVYTATVPGITELRSGVCVMLMNGVVTSASGFTININNLGAKPVYSTLAAATRATTLFNVNYTLLLVYNEERVSGGCWDAYYGYDSNTNTIGYQLRTNSTTMPTTDKFYRYRLLFTSADRTHFVPANTSSSTNATAARTVNQRPIDPIGAIYYYGHTTAINSGANPTASYFWTQYNINLGYSFNRTGATLAMTNHVPVYIKCAPQSDGSAIIDADNPYVQVLPSTADGKIYIFLGVASGAETVELVPDHPVFCYRNGQIRLWTGNEENELPNFTAADEGKVLGIENGVLAWVEQTGGGGGDHEDVPSYVKAEAQSVAARVAAKMQSDSIVFVIGSDSHQDATDNVKNGNLHGGMAMKSLAYVLPFDFAAFLGDYTTGSATTTIAEGTSHIEQINADIDEAFQGLPQFRTVGNHDPLGYSYSQNSEILTQAQLYSLIGKYNAEAGNTMGSTAGGYCYRDFAEKHLRVVCLNTAEMPTASSGGAEYMTDAQKTWFSQTMASTPSGYGLIILSHHPLDWGGVCAASNLVYDYINGNSFNADYVLAFHGHTHCFKVDDLNRIVNSVGVPYDVKRIAVPNMCFGRNNEYGSNSGAEYYGIEFGETTTYNKTANSGDDTAFCVIVVNPTEQKVHAICYGAGYDREVYFGTETVAVTGVTLNTASGTLAPGATTTLTATVAPANATNKTVLWTTSNSSVATVSNGTVTAVGVGTATITATTQDGGFTASYALTVEAAKRGNLRDYFGYTDGKRISTGDGTYRNLSGGVVVEYIDLSEFATDKSGNSAMNTIVIRTKGVSFQSWQSGSNYNDNAYVFYNASKAFATSGYLTEGSSTHGSITITRAFSGTDMTLTINAPWGVIKEDGAERYLRLCGLGSGANLDIRVNETFD